MRRLTLLASAALAMVSTAALAQGEQWPRWYVGVSGQLNFLNDSDLRSGANTGEVNYDTGGGVTAAIGYIPPFAGMFGNFRVEAELGYRHAGLDGYTLAGVSGPLSGNTQAWTYMGNLYYDFRNESRWIPYVGAGAGGANVKLSRNASTIGNTNDHDTVFAYQFMAGIAYAPEAIPMTEWNLGYRYFGTADPEFTTATGTLELEDYNAHSVELGARFRF